MTDEPLPDSDKLPPPEDTPEARRMRQLAWVVGQKSRLALRDAVRRTKSPKAVVVRISASEDREVTVTAEGFEFVPDAAFQRLYTASHGSAIYKWTVL